MNYPLNKLLLLSVLAFTNIEGHTASFDCSKASSHHEKMICSDIELSMMDSKLLNYYHIARQATNNSPTFKANGKKALQWRINNCNSSECLRNWYRTRQEELRTIASLGFTPPTNCIVDGSHTTIKGVVSRRTFENVNTGEPITDWILKSNTQKCAYKSDMMGNLSRIEPQQEFQLVIDDYLIYKNYLNKQVEVNGLPYSSHNGNHFTDLLIIVEEIR